MFRQYLLHRQRWLVNDVHCHMWWLQRRSYDLRQYPKWVLQCCMVQKLMVVFYQSCQHRVLVVRVQHLQQITHSLQRQFLLVVNLRQYQNQLHRVLNYLLLYHVVACLEIPHRQKQTIQHWFQLLLETTQYVLAQQNCQLIRIWIRQHVLRTNFSLFQNHLLVHNVFLLGVYRPGHHHFCNQFG